VLEGLDLRPFKLSVGETRELRSPIADILVAWGYARPARAKPARARPARPTKKAPPGRKK
jgi:hypothetical protein